MRCHLSPLTTFVTALVIIKNREQSSQFLLLDKDITAYEIQNHLLDVQVNV